MSEKVKLYYQCSGDIPLWDFCLHAWYGARQNNIPAIKFETADDIPNSPYHIVVGSVEECRKWLEKNNYKSPEAINCVMRYYLHAKMYPSAEQFINNNLEYPIFIKPFNIIKEFTGTVVKNKNDAALVLNGIKSGIESKSVVDITSEWRCYIHKGKVIKICHYLGDPLILPPDDLVPEIMYRIDKSRNFIVLKDYNSYTIDLGYTQEQGWIIIEFNDAWAIGNYGLDADTYYNFIKDRWFQLTGALPYKK